MSDLREVRHPGPQRRLGHRGPDTAAKDAQPGWLPLQDEMVDLSTNSVHRVMQNATHTSLTEDEGDSAISVQAILDVVAAVRSGTPLVK